MARLRTHYDNLKVTREAPKQVIDAAFQALKRRFEQERGLSRAASERNMAIVREAHEVLSDPVRRRQHDEWIRLMEMREEPASKRSWLVSQSQRAVAQIDTRIQSISSTKRLGWAILGIAIGLVWFLTSSRSPRPIDLLDHSTSAHAKSASAGKSRFKPDAPLTPLLSTSEQNPVRVTGEPTAEIGFYEPANKIVPAPARQAITARRAPAELMQPLPDTGVMWVAWPAHDDWPELRLNAEAASGHFYVKVISDDGLDEIAKLFVRQGAIGSVNLPPGLYRMRYATGRIWYGQERLFGASTSTSESEKPIRLWSERRENGVVVHGGEIELLKQLGGNYQTRSIPMSDF